MTKELEMFNQHQQDVRSRADSLAKAIFVLSGGSLTVSIGLFLKTERLPLSDCALVILKYSWWLLFATIALGVFMLSTIIVRDFLFGEQWRKSFHDKNIDVSGFPGFFEFLIVALGLLGITTFVAGMFGLAYVATEAVAGIHT
ncbi:hypothetical protein VIOR3934_01390 [Vibrio orientalis CIP 102891 = ATCC 33934]|uniref:Uncharacterized protein n=1 Tax=Vibrio orientalis CIP 102891 = ATCC 33934 TaxID=675816 RepID=C9QK62_VIBOR|nr:hypothetical protein [Vibrio orientalis]EEX92053.1 hypothetical protein VIA_002697 [Vibrio orientalis CIP 102891 = ATCC 33934]EGU48791.1 hypothetical protein VIOR3934_01390 [Vibrio orientalis CIP 102891 = ATCC 33934]